MDTIWTPAWENVQGAKYLALHNSLRKDIEAGKLAPGDQLPPVRDLAWKLGITPGTVARAYQKGVDEGVLSAVVGRGTFVADVAGSDQDIDAGDINPVNLRSMRTPNVGQEKAYQQALLAMAKRSTKHYSQYPEPDDYAPLRQALCNWLSQVNLRAEPDDIVLSYGAQNGLLIAMSTCLSGKKPVVLCEKQVYFGLRQAAELLRVDLVGIEMDGEGILPEALERACQTTGASVLTTCSNVHNPTTLQTSHRRRLQIAEIANRYDLQIIDDDCWGNEPVEAESYRAICRDRYWYVTSLTKMVTAGLRFGFVLCPPGQAKQATRTMQSMYHGLSRPVAEIALELLQSGQAEAIRAQVMQVIEDRVQRAINILGHCDIRWRSKVPFIWLYLPKGWRPSNFALHCERQNILIRTADEFTLREGNPENAIRISLNANLPLDVYEGALRKIATMLAEPPLEHTA